MKKPIFVINPYYYEYNGAMRNAMKESCFQSVWQAGGATFTLYYPKSFIAVQWHPELLPKDKYQKKL